MKNALMLLLTMTEVAGGGYICSGSHFFFGFGFRALGPIKNDRFVPITNQQKNGGERKNQQELRTRLTHHTTMSIHPAEEIKAASSNDLIVEATVVNVVEAQLQVVEDAVVIKEGGGSEEKRIPYPDEPHWHDEEYARCCKCSGHCWCVWLCPCVFLAHIASKLTAMDRANPYCLNFTTIIIIGVFLTLLDMFLALLGVDVNPHYIFYSIVCLQLRQKISAILKFRKADGCKECLFTFFCLPCAMTQMFGTLWGVPEEKPGISWRDNFSQIV